MVSSHSAFGRFRKSFVASIGLATAATALPLAITAPANAATGPAAEVPLNFTPGQLATSPVETQLAIGGNSFTTNNSTKLFETPAFNPTGTINSKGDVVAYAPDGTLYVSDGATVNAFRNGDMIASVDLNSGITNDNQRIALVEDITFDEINNRTYLSVRYGQRTSGYVVVLDGGAPQNGVVDRWANESFDDELWTPIGIAVSPDGSSVYVSRSGGITAFNTQTGEQNAVFSKTNFGAGELKISPDGEKLYVANGSLTAIDASTGIDTYIRGTTDVKSIALSPDGDTLYVSSGSSLVEIDTRDLTITETTAIPLDLPSDTASFYGKDLALSANKDCVYIGGGLGQRLQGTSVVSFTRNSVFAIPLESGVDCGGTVTDNPADQSAYAPGQELHVSFTGLRANETYRVEGHSTPFCVDDDVVANSNGEIAFSCTIPNDVADGVHHFYVYHGDAEVGSIEFRIAQNGQNTDTDLTGEADTTPDGGDSTPPDQSGSGSLGSIFGSLGG